MTSSRVSSSNYLPPMYSYKKVFRLSTGKLAFEALSLVIIRTSLRKLWIFCSFVRGGALLVEAPSEDRLLARDVG
jgi:hypothetical protein